MVRHILLLQPRTDVSAAAIDECRQAITGLVGKVPGLLHCQWGENFAPAERRDGFTHGFSMDFADRASLEAYGPNPDHQQAARKVRATFERVVAFDFTL